MAHPRPATGTGTIQGTGVNVYGGNGSMGYGGGGGTYVTAGKRIAVFGDSSTHGGNIITTNTDGHAIANGLRIAVHGATLRCPAHGETMITAITVKSKINNKLIITQGAFAVCGAIIQPPDRKIYVE